MVKLLLDCIKALFIFSKDIDDKSILFLDKMFDLLLFIKKLLRIRFISLSLCIIDSLMFFRLLD